MVRITLVVTYRYVLQVYMVRITEGRWSSLAAKTIPTLEVAFDATTAAAEAMVPVNNESVLYYRCHQVTDPKLNPRP